MNRSFSVLVFSQPQQVEPKKGKRADDLESSRRFDTYYYYDDSKHVPVVLAYWGIEECDSFVHENDLESNRTCLSLTSTSMFFSARYARSLIALFLLSMIITCQATPRQVARREMHRVWETLRPLKHDKVRHGERRETQRGGASIRGNSRPRLGWPGDYAWHQGGAAVAVKHSWMVNREGQDRFRIPSSYKETNRKVRDTWLSTESQSA